MEFIRKHFALINIFLLTVLTSFYAYIIVINSGSSYCAQGVCGDFFWGAQTVDGLWHVSIMKHSFKSFPFTIPIAAGIPFGGYNYLLDLLFSPLQLLGLDAVFIYFKIMPLIWLISIFVILLALAKKRGVSYTNLASQVFFIFFSTGLYFIFAIYHHKTIFETDGSGGVHILTNLQFAYSLVGMLLVIYSLISLKPSVKKDLILAILLFFVTGFKFYSGILIAVLIGTYYLVSYLKERRDIFSYLRTGLITSLAFIAVVLLIYNPFTEAGKGEPVFSIAPFAIANRLIEEPDRFYLPKLALARYTLLETGWGPRLILLEIFIVVSYLIIELGARILGLLYPIKKLLNKTLSTLDISLVASILTGITLSLLLVQRGQWWNVIQFLYVAMFLLSFHSAEALESIINSKTRLGYAIVVGIIIITLPFNIVVAGSFGNFRDGVYLPEEEKKFLKKIEALEGDTILRLPLDVKPSFPRLYPLPISHVNDASFLSVYSGKANYLGAREIVKLLDIDFQDRLNAITHADIETLKKDVDYLYIYGDDKPYCDYIREIRSHGKEILSYKFIHVYEL